MLSIAIYLIEWWREGWMSNLCMRVCTWVWVPMMLETHINLIIIVEWSRSHSCEYKLNRIHTKRLFQPWIHHPLEVQLENGSESRHVWRWKSWQYNHNMIKVLKSLFSNFHRCRGMWRGQWRCNFHTCSFIFKQKYQKFHFCHKFLVSSK